jgi:hypothetical protein
MLMVLTPVREAVKEEGSWAVMAATVVVVFRSTARRKVVALDPIARAASGMPAAVPCEHRLYGNPISTCDKSCNRG